MDSDYDHTKTVKIKSIKPIDGDTVHKICSGQVVLSLAVAVKELVENSLDACATNIEVRFKNYGVDLIEVIDNGSGVTEENFPFLTLKHHTSKLNDYCDLLGVASFGFRGEALSSLCALANITICTRHKSCDYATKIEYDHNGFIVQKTRCSRQIGTTVSMSNLFYSLPVRQKEFHKNVKREFNKMTQLLYAYCLISLGVKITCSNQTSSNSKTMIVATQGSMSYKDNIACIFGFKQLQSILEIKPEYVTNMKENIFRGLSQDVFEDQQSVNIEDVEIDLSEDSNDAEDKDASIQSSQKSQGYKNTPDPIEFTGFISSCAHGSGRSSTDRQFYYVNSRPCEPIKVMKLVNEIYRQYNPNQYPFIFLNINLERELVDVNVTPDKRKVFMTREKYVLDVLKNSLLKLFECIPRTLKVENSGVSESIKPDLSQPRIFNAFLQQFSSKKAASSTNTIEKSGKTCELKRKSTSMLDFISSKVTKSNQKEVDENVEVCKSKEDNTLTEENITLTEEEQVKAIKHEKESDSDDNSTEQHINLNSSDDVANGEHEEIKAKEVNIDTKVSESPVTKDKGEFLYLESTDKLPATQIRSLSDVVIEKSHSISCKTKTLLTRSHTSPNSSTERPAKKSKVLTDQEDFGKYNRKTVQLNTSIEHVKVLAEKYNNKKANLAPDKVKFKSSINPVFNKKCEEELNKEISKDSFKQMKVIGQFNLGFIITKLDDDLFIIDQHATDEIYNFETLQKTTVLTNQKLVIPQQLELSGVNEQILMDNLEIFKKNGFTFEIDENAEPTKKVKLLTLPMSKNWVFGKEDIEELLFMLRESPSEYCRPSRVRAMFASRACRKSVMIGTALSKADMRVLVDHMAEIDKPWNCPHGRPTIRHLVNLAMVHTKNCDDNL